jgi:hypothetical protein
MHRTKNAVTALVLCAASAALSQNLLTNPGFESSGSGWTLWKDASASAAVAEVTYPTTGARSGTRFAQIVVTTPSTENWHIQFQPPAGWDAVIGGTYDMTFWAKSAASTNMHFSVQDGPNNGFMYRSGFDFALTPEWTQYSFSYQSDVEGSGALRFFLYVGSVVDTYGFDDFSLLAGPVNVKNGAKVQGRQALQVVQGADKLTLSLEGINGTWKAELMDVRGASLAAATGKADGSLQLAHPQKTGTYFVRATAGTRSWIRKVTIR